MAKIWKGVSAYAAGAWDQETKKNFFKCYPADLHYPAIAMLDGPWSTPKMIGVAKRFCAKWSDREHLIEVHISAETARRTGRSGNQISPGLSVKDYDKALRAKQKVILEAVDLRVRELLPLFAAIANENTHIWLSTGLEHNLSVEAATILARTVRKAVREWQKQNGPDEAFDIKGKLQCPIRVINNPMRQQGELPVKGILTERHGRNPGEVWNFDGTTIGSHPTIEDISAANALKAIQKAKGQYKAVFLWHAEPQGLNNLSGQGYDGRTFEITPQIIADDNMILRSIP